jgi:hypothetical protein
MDGKSMDVWKKFVGYWCNPANSKEKFSEHLMRPGDDIHYIKVYIEKVESE